MGGWPSGQPPCDFQCKVWGIALFLNVFCIVGQAHVALAAQCVVHGKGAGQTMAGVTAGAQFEVVPKQLLVVGMCALLDDQFGTLHRTLASEVGHALLSDDDVDIVLGVVLVADEGYDGTDDSSLGH